MEKLENLLCYTIGHSNYSSERFIELLKKNNIDCVVDVRSAPYSKHTPQFNKEKIKNELKKNAIEYIFMGRELGGRYEDANLQFDDGKVDYSKVRQRKEFQQGIARVIDGIKKGYKIALMCSEIDTFNCHRLVLVSFELNKNDVIIYHILDNGDLLPNDELEKRMIKAYEGKYNQLDLFGGDREEKDILDYAYREKNKEISFGVTK